MEEKKPVGLVPANDSPLRVNLLAATTTAGPRLTPTGKISHAKTRVYTQRYRKEWEQMPEFKGWLTSVPFQPTRAYCTYCKKNLHAHRLSLLKHTCTMKHQRAAEMHKAEFKKNMGVTKSEPGVEIEEGEEVEVYTKHEWVDHSRTEAEDNEDETEYVVERLETDDDEADESGHIKENLTSEEMEEEEEEEDDLHARLVADDDEVKQYSKKIKISSVESCRDTLAEAMAHVHGEYLEETDDQGNVQVEMVVDSEEQTNPEMQVMTILPDIEDDKHMVRDSRENGRSIRRSEIKSDKKLSSRLSDDSKTQNDAGIVMACTVPVLGTTYNISSSVVPTSGTIGVLQPINTLPIAPAQTKTITLTTGKTLTLTGGSFQPGGQYVLRKLKGSKLPTLVMAEKKSEDNQTMDTSKIMEFSKVPQEQLAVASTSRQSSNKKPRISTHVVDTSKGLPIGGLQVSLYKLMDGRWTFLNESNTSANGRCTDLIDNAKVTFTAGRYKMHFDVDKYFTLRRIETMYPFIEIVFDVKNPAGNYHIPVLLSPFGYTTYRGSERLRNPRLPASSVAYNRRFGEILFSQGNRRN